MFYAISAPNVGRPSDLVRLAVEADAAGWDGVFLWDHLHLVRAMHLEMVDPWVMLGAMAQATQRVRLGAMVTPLPRRRPWVVAKEVTTLDHLSGGRAVVGVGLGFPADDEFGAFGEETDDRTRAALLDEGLDVLDQCLRGGPVRHSGVHFQVDADLHPGCLQQPRPPIWVAGMWPNRAPFRRAARWDGVAPVAPTGEPTRPAEIADVVTAVGGPRPGYDVIAGWHWDHTPAEYADAGATWLVESRWPDGDWYDELRDAARNGPPR